MNDRSAQIFSNHFMLSCLVTQLIEQVFVGLKASEPVKKKCKSKTLVRFHVNHDHCSDDYKNDDSDGMTTFFVTVSKVEGIVIVPYNFAVTTYYFGLFAHGIL